MPELKRYILNFGYGINFKYEEMLAHSFDRFCDCKTDFNKKCGCLNEDLDKHHNWGEYINNLKIFCEKLYHS